MHDNRNTVPRINSRQRELRFSEPPSLRIAEDALHNIITNVNRTLDYSDNDSQSTTPTNVTNFDVKDEPRSSRSIIEKSDEIMEKVEHDKHVSTVEIARELGIDHKTILNHLHKTGYKRKLDVWVPHELSVKNMMNRINICDTLLKQNEIEPFLKRMITGDEKWITYDNPTRKRLSIGRGVVFHHDNAQHSQKEVKAVKHRREQLQRLNKQKIEDRHIREKTSESDPKIRPTLTIEEL
ncbi:SETMR methyltransferase, partial [Acromyrmex insinuator]